MADEPTNTDPAPIDPEVPATGPADLGDGGKTALASERAARKEADRRATAAEKKVKEHEDANKSELEKASTRADAAEQRAQALVERTVKAEIKAAAGDFADPSDAAAFLDLSTYTGEDGEIDGEKIKTDLAELLKRKPHLAKGRSGPKPDPSQGAKPGGTPDLQAQIAQAEKDRDFPKAIALKRQLANSLKPTS